MVNIGLLHTSVLDCHPLELLLSKLLVCCQFALIAGLTSLEKLGPARSSALRNLHSRPKKQCKESHWSCAKQNAVRSAHLPTLIQSTCMHIVHTFIPFIDTKVGEWPIHHGPVATLVVALVEAPIYRLVLNGVEAMEEAVTVIEVAVDEGGKGCNSIWVLARIESWTGLWWAGIVAAPAMVLVGDVAEGLLASPRVGLADVLATS